MTVSTQPPLLFLDVDGPLIPFGSASHSYPAYGPGPEAPGTGSNPILARIDPRHGPRLAALPCELVWATTWMDDANEWIGPRIGLPRLAVVRWPETSGDDGAAGWEEREEQEVQDERSGLHWKTRALVAWAAGRPFVWVDDEITDIDRAWVAVHHPGRALLHRVDPRQGLTGSDFTALDSWLRRAVNA
ncbi:HAD domain-containing protein [Streptomyces sp. SM11]|uniref:HAD domain-containing protein n=1 Tax=Streptomyces sp. SM11 TaxID=565557 RepID=UPI000CD4B6F7|nr:HAD domain-containing protein [Streptomyces sp. SM11]